jgi:hypothetical protein
VDVLRGRDCAGIAFPTPCSDPASMTFAQSVIGIDGTRQHMHSRLLRCGRNVVAMSNEQINPGASATLARALHQRTIADCAERPFLLRTVVMAAFPGRSFGVDMTPIVLDVAAPTDVVLRYLGRVLPARLHGGSARAGDELAARGWSDTRHSFVVRGFPTGAST